MPDFLPKFLDLPITILMGVIIAVIFFLLARRFGLLARLAALFYRIEEKAIGRRSDKSTSSPKPTSPASRPNGFLIVSLCMVATIAISGIWMGLENRADQRATWRTIHDLRSDTTVTNRLAALESENTSLKEKLAKLERHPAIVSINDTWTQRLWYMIVLAQLTDTDGDGIVDADDYCPTLHRGKDNGFGDGHTWTNGCPVVDQDDDGIPDALDKCPAVDGLTYDLHTVGNIPIPDDSLVEQIGATFYGCPDSDNDAIPDAADLCPNIQADNDEDLDGCKDAQQDLRIPGDHIWLQQDSQRYGYQAGQLVGYFRGERSPGGVRIEFLIACEAMGADGIQLSGDTTDYTLVKSWGVCRPQGGV